MWLIVKFDKKNFFSFKKEFLHTLGKDTLFYSPKFCIKKNYKVKFNFKEINLLGDYIFVYSNLFKNLSIIESLKFTKGLKYFLSGCSYSQKEIRDFVKKCKDSEDKKGYLTNNFFDLIINTNYTFTDGPFVNKIFKIINFNKENIKILLGNIETSINKNKFLINPA